MRGQMILTVLNIVFGIITLIGFPFSVWAFFKTRLVKRLQLKVMSVHPIIFPTDLPGLTGKLGEINVGERLTLVSLRLLNKGNTGVGKDDARGDVVIDFDIANGSVIGAYTSTSKDQPHTGSKISIVSPHIRFEWEYIDPKDRLTINAYTTGEFKGAKLKGPFKTGVVVENVIHKQKTTAWQHIAIITLIVIYPAIVALVALEFQDISKIAGMHFNNFIRFVIVALLSAVALVVIFIAGITVLEQMFKGFKAMVKRAKSGAGSRRSE